MWIDEICEILILALIMERIVRREVVMVIARSVHTVITGIAVVIVRLVIIFGASVRCIIFQIGRAHV